jgi:hypothetical protein
MLARLFEVRETKDKGKGLFAKELVPKSTIVFFECQWCKKIPKSAFALLSEEERAFALEYGYAKADGSYLVPCDEVIYLNHSCNANILDSGRGFDIVVRDIVKGEEATYDYKLFGEGTDLGFPCLCGGDACCGTVRCTRSKELASFWKERIDSAMKSKDAAYQPLEKFR